MMPSDYLITIREEDLKKIKEGKVVIRSYFRAERPSRNWFEVADQDNICIVRSNDSYNSPDKAEKAGARYLKIIKAGLHRENGDYSKTICQIFKKRGIDIEVSSN